MGWVLKKQWDCSLILNLSLIHLLIFSSLSTDTWSQLQEEENYICGASALGLAIVSRIHDESVTFCSCWNPGNKYDLCFSSLYSPCILCHEEKQWFVPFKIEHEWLSIFNRLMNRYVPLGISFCQWWSIQPRPIRVITRKRRGIHRWVGNGRSLKY